MRLMVSGVTPKNEAMLFKGTTSFKLGQRSIKFLYRISGVQYESSNRSYTIQIDSLPHAFRIVEFSYPFPNIQ